MPPNSKKLIGALIAAALAIAVYYGLIGQQAANNIQSQANQTLGTGSVSQQPPAPSAEAPSTPTQAPAAPVPQTAPQTPRQ